MKTVLLSIKPKYCSLIISGQKTVEIRKTRPKIDTPFKCYIYCTQGSGRNTLNIPIRREQLLKSNICLTAPIGNGKVIGEFVCDNIIEWADDDPPPVPLKETCLSYMDIRRYAPTDATIFCWHISDLKIYDKSKELSEFCLLGGKPLSRPPQSWCYVEELN